ncbi:pca operon transcription factor PcaQ [Pandoraea sp.]|uniref:pca operon transcription factor PcaQ n=1 Tax=Pandoraea sp. TaxID=1883445 RepID=UPI001213EC30|nr:pca operon transcription factor PcaQ [Pandoraea sp.]TAL56441.1 MAG: pca operon transcription factor PcaQ [Pandoraea sp.]TAM15260.1 MAG: pca operon transcription factor PcaQ [Pandoraea sp.]
MKNPLTDGRIKLRHLQCFLAIAQFGSLQKAATALSITQPAVSKTVAELEGLLGVALFERGRGGATPTRQAQWFLPHASACLNALQTGVNALARTSGHAPGFINLGILPTLAAACLPPVAAQLRRQWPAVSLRVVTGTNKELTAKLKAGEVEVALCRSSDPELMAGLSFEYLCGEPLVAVVRADHPLLRAPLAIAAGLRDYPVLLPPPGTVIRQSADRLLAAAGATPLQAHIELLSVSAGKALTLENDAVWFVPRGTVAHDLADGSLTCLPLASAGAEEPVGLALRIDAPQAPVLRALLEAMRTFLRRAGSS